MTKIKENKIKLIKNKKGEIIGATINETITLEEFKKHFIKDILDEAVRRLEGEKEKKDEINSPFSNRNLRFTDGFNEALNTAIKIVKSLK